MFCHFCLQREERERTPTPALVNDDRESIDDNQFGESDEEERSEMNPKIVSRNSVQHVKASKPLQPKVSLIF